MTIIIYVLCSDMDKYNSTKKMYPYHWAKPLLINNHDYSFENTIWNQLMDIYDEWQNIDMVGTISHSAFKKIKVDEMDEIINKKYYLPNKYYHFMDSNVLIPNCNTNKHPNFLIIWNDILSSLNLKNTTENCCNYWMCTPSLMKHFINWYTTICLPVLNLHPLIFTDAQYSSDYNNTIIKEKLIQLWGKPYYPHFPFIVERLNKCFFEKYY